MTYTYTVTTYSYNCQVCGTRSHGVPRMSEIPRCHVCDIALCKHCFQHGFCPAHWNQLPPDLQQAFAHIHKKVERRKKLGFFGFFFFLAGALGLMIGLGSEIPEAGIPAGFASLLLAIISILPAVSPVKRLRKKIRKYIARHVPQGSVASGSVASVPPQIAISPQSTYIPSQSLPKQNDASKKFCSYCGALINKEAVFCEKCGTKLPPPVP